ncbi:MAG: helix-turn-helix domain-containing protein [Persicimonas sp.]
MAVDPNTSSVEEQVRRMSPVAAPDEQREEFAQLFRMLEDVADDVRQSGDAMCQIIGPEGQTVTLPESVFYLLERVVEVLARGDAITVVPVHKELTTQQAADILNISRQYLVRLLDDGKIPFTRTGTHRRIRFADVMTYKKERDRERADSLDELTRLSQQYGGYDELP